MTVDTLTGQLNECSHRLEKLKGELKRYQGYLEDAIKGIQSGQQNNSLTNSPRLLNGSRRRHRRNSGGSAAEEESLSRSASDSSVTNNTNNKRSAPGTPQLNHGWVSGVFFDSFGFFFFSTPCRLFFIRRVNEFLFLNSVFSCFLFLIDLTTFDIVVQTVLKVGWVRRIRHCRGPIRIPTNTTAALRGIPRANITRPICWHRWGRVKLSILSKVGSIG